MSYISRHLVNNKFGYKGATREDLPRIKSLKIPPMWTNVKIDKTIPIVRDNILHLTVDKIRLASTTVTWAAAFSQSPVKMVQ